MKTEHRILLTSVILGFLVGIFDTILDYFFFYPGQSFLELVASDVPRHEIYIRFLFFVCFIVFGFICAKVISKLKKTEEEKEKLINKLQKSIKEIKTLRGFIPICASCKNIRDDKGFWNQVETYLKKHSEVEFTHSICPVCAKKLYPELLESKDKINLK